MKMVLIYCVTPVISRVNNKYIISGDSYFYLTRFLDCVRPILHLIK